MTDGRVRRPVSGRREHTQPALSTFDRPARLRVLAYELNVVKQAKARVEDTFRPNRSIPEAVAVVEAISVLVAVAEQRIAALRASCVVEGHIWSPPELGSQYHCLVCGDRQEGVGDER